MSPFVGILFFGFILFLASLILHLVLWRLFDIKKEILTLFSLFIGLPLLALAGLWASGVWDATQALAIGVFDFALAVSYIQTYPTLRTDIPTFRILILLDHYRGTGLDERFIIERLRDSPHMFSRKVVELERDGLAVRREGRIYLTFAGLLITRIFIYYRRMLGLPYGAG